MSACTRYQWTGLCRPVHHFFTVAPACDAKNDLSQFVGQELSKSDRPELTSASTVISGGEWMGCVLKSGMKIEVQAGVGFIYKIISFDSMLCCLNSLNLKVLPSLIVIYLCSSHKSLFQWGLCITCRIGLNLILIHLPYVYTCMNICLCYFEIGRGMKNGENFKLEKKFGNYKYMSCLCELN